MTPVRQKIAAHVRSRRNTYVDHLLEMTAANVAKAAAGASPLTRRDFEQMVDGFLAMLNEALTTESTEIRTFYVETVIPGLMQSGSQLPLLVGGTVKFAILTSNDAIVALAPEERDEATVWFAGFFESYVTDMARIALEASK